jgi:uncharacterized protein YkwD
MPRTRRRSDDQNQIQQSSAPIIKKSHSADNIESRKKGRVSRRSPPRRNDSFGLGTKKRGGELSQSDHGLRGQKPMVEPWQDSKHSEKLHGTTTSDTLCSHRNCRKSDALSRSDHRRPHAPHRVNMTSNAEIGLMSRNLTSRKLEESTDLSTDNDNVGRCDAKRRSSHSMNALELGNGDAQRRRGQLLSRIERAPRRVKSSTADISQMARLSRRENMSVSLDVASDPSAKKTAKATSNELDELSRSEHKRSTLLTTRPRGGDLSMSEHRARSSRPQGHARRSSKEFDPSMRCLINSEDNGNYSTTTQKGVRQHKDQCSARPPRRTRSGGAEIELMSRMARKTSPRIRTTSDHDPAVSSSASPKSNNTGAPAALPEYNAMKQKYQQGWDRASCFVVVNEIRTRYALPPLQRDNNMDIEAQTFAEAIARSNGNAFLKIEYLAHVLHGTAVLEMHHLAMTQGHGSKSKAHANILNPDFQAMGVGVATGANGVLYVCELFRGTFTLCCAAEV